MLRLYPFPVNFSLLVFYRPLVLTSFHRRAFLFNSESRISTQHNNSNVLFEFILRFSYRCICILLTNTHVHISSNFFAVVIIFPFNKQYKNSRKRHPKFRQQRALLRYSYMHNQATTLDTSCIPLSPFVFLYPYRFVSFPFVNCMYAYSHTFIVTSSL